MANVLQIKSVVMILVKWIFRVFIWIGWIPWMVWISRIASWNFILLLSSIDPIFILAHPLSNLKFHFFSTRILLFRFVNIRCWKIKFTWWCSSINWILIVAILWWYYGRKLRIVTLNHHRTTEIWTLWYLNYLEIRLSNHQLRCRVDW